jgi:hypothetical protein
MNSNPKLETIQDRNSVEFTIEERQITDQVSTYYLRLTAADMEFVVNAIHDSQDLLRLLFSVQTLRKILSIGDPD